MMIQIVKAKDFILNLETAANKAVHTQGSFACSVVFMSGPEVNSQLSYS